jgi:hypothetical protein
VRWPPAIGGGEPLVAVQCRQTLQSAVFVDELYCSSCGDSELESKTAPVRGRLSEIESNRNQVKRSSSSCLRRQAMKPIPAKPRIIIAQVEGSGTPDPT